MALHEFDLIIPWIEGGNHYLITMDLIRTRIVMIKWNPQKWSMMHKRLISHRSTSNIILQGSTYQILSQGNDAKFWVKLDF